MTQIFAVRNQISRKFDYSIFFPKSAPNFMACFTGLVFHLPRVDMHQTNSTHVGSHHVEGFQEYFIYKEDRSAKTIDTWDESPCTTASLLLRKSVENIRWWMKGVKVSPPVSCGIGIAASCHCGREFLRTPRRSPQCDIHSTTSYLPQGLQNPIQGWTPGCRKLVSLSPLAYHPYRALFMSGESSDCSFLKKKIFWKNQYIQDTCLFFSSP